MTHSDLLSPTVSRPDALDVLIVEDEPDAAEEIRDAIDDDALTISLAGDAAAALERIASHGLPEILVTDIRMPNMSGLEFVERLLADQGRGGQCAVIFISGHADMDAVIQALRFEAVDFLRKPIDRRTLRAAVGRARDQVMRRRAEAGRQLAIISDLRAFKAQADRVSELLGEFPHGLSLDSERRIADESRREAGVPMARGAWASLVAKLRRLRRAQYAIGDERLAENASLDMLLDLLSAEFSGDPVTVTSLCAASGVSQTTALRRIDELEGAGLLQRTPDPEDRRRIYVVLSESGRKRVLSYLSSVSHLIA